jgi:hypothetical protein
MKPLLVFLIPVALSAAELIGVDAGIIGGMPEPAPVPAQIGVLAPQPVFVTVRLTIKPLSLISTKSVYGKGQTVGKWTPTVCNDSAVKVDVSRDRLLMAVPELHELPSDLAQDVIGRTAAADPRSVIGDTGDAAMGLMAQVTTAAGVIAKSSRATYAGLGIGVLQIGLQLLKKHAPKPQPYYSELLPDSFALGPMQCTSDIGKHFFIVASLLHGAATFDRIAVAMPVR